MSSELPVDAIQPVQPPIEKWFEYLVRVQPHHTDYAGVVWHGTYITWLEEARVEALRTVGVEYADLVAMGCVLPVIELAIRYHRPLKMGMAAVVKARMLEMKGVRIKWDYQIQSFDRQEVCVTAQVTLVTTDWEQGKIMRQLPTQIKAALAKLSSWSGVV